MEIQSNKDEKRIRKGLMYEVALELSSRRSQELILRCESEDQGKTVQKQLKQPNFLEVYGL